MISHSSCSVSPGDYSYIDGLSRSNFIGQGSISRRFRARLCEVSRRDSCILTNSGTAALELVLHALRTRWPKRRYVAVSAYVCPAVVSSILNEGLKPLFADVRADSMNLDTKSLGEIVDERTLAVICTNIGGIPDDYAGVGRLPCAMVSDCAQGVGSTWDGFPIAELGQFAVMSFGPTKMLTAGIGGALLGGSPELAAAAADYAVEEWDVTAYRRLGFQPTYGQHFSDLNAGLGLAQLRKLPVFVKRRQAIGARYTAVLERQASIGLPETPSAATGNCYRYYFFSDHAKDWLKVLRDAGIDARQSISHNMSEYFKGIGRLPNLRRNAGRPVSLPIYPGLVRREISQVVDALQRGLEMGLK